MFRNTLTRASTVGRLALNRQSRNLACASIYIKGLPLGSTEEELRPHLEKFGPIYEIHFPEQRFSDRRAIAFAKLYSGELPPTIEKVAALPDPTMEEINELNNRCAQAIDHLNTLTIGDALISASMALSNKYDAIQFNARFVIRKANDPEFARYHDQRKASKNGATGAMSKEYRAGYAAGFKDGVIEANSSSSEGN